MLWRSPVLSVSRSWPLPGAWRRGPPLRKPPVQWRGPRPLRRLCPRGRRIGDTPYRPGLSPGLPAETCREGGAVQPVAYVQRRLYGITLAGTR